MNTWTRSAIASFLMSYAMVSHAQSVVTVNTAYATPTQTVNVSGSKFGDSEAVDVYVDTVDTLLLVTSATGTFTGTVTIPASAAPGNHYITAIGRHSGDAAQSSITVTTPWVEQGFGAGHLGWNHYENVISPSNVSTLGPMWDAATNSAGAAPIVNVKHVIIANLAGVQSLSPTTGSSQWTVLTGQIFYASPALANGIVYIGSGNTSNFYALNETTGATIWTTALGGSLESSPIVVGNVIYFGGVDGKVYALNATTGKIIWTYTTGSSIDSTPAVSNAIVYIGSTDGKVYALNAATGALIWSYTTGGEVESTPAVINGILYVGSDDANVYALRAKGPDTGGLLWKFTTGDSVYGSPAVANSTVFIGSADSKLYALNAGTGALEWSYTTGGIVENTIVANGVVYSTSRDGGAYVFDATNGEVLNVFQTGYTFLGGPAVSDGILYFCTYGGDTYAFSLGAGANSVPRRFQVPPTPGSLRPDLSLRETR